MKLVKVRKSEYKAEVANGINLWVVNEGRGWVWFLGGYEEGKGSWETDNNGPFNTRREAIEDATNNYEDLIRNWEEDSNRDWDLIH